MDAPATKQALAHEDPWPTKKSDAVQAFLNTKGPCYEGPWGVAGAGFEPATFGL